MKLRAVCFVVALWGLTLNSAMADDAADLFAAARLGDAQRVVELLTADPGLVHARDAEGATPLHYAAASHRAATVAVLLARDAEVNAADARGMTPLHLAASAADVEVLRAVLAAGAGVNARNAQRETALHLAAQRMNAEALRILIEYGADVNAQDERGRTPMHVLGLAARDDELYAAEFEIFVKLLIEAGADPELLDADGVPAGQPRQEPPPPPPLRDTYRTYAQIGPLLAQYASAHPTIARSMSLGQSVQGRELWALNISDNVGVEEDEPEFKYISTMHGDEWTGTEMCLFLADYLLTNYGSNQQATNIVDNIDLWIVPLMNPDGYVAVERENANGIDLNRAFPEGTEGEPNSTAGREAEVAVIMNWSFANSFVCSANFHTGALVTNYPFDSDGMGSVYSPTPDDDLFIWMSEEYSRHNLPMWNSSSFYHGITNGADWYEVLGGMQDWNYRYMGDNEVTIELNYYPKIPSYSQIPGLWNDNRDAMLAYLETCLIGVRGIVTDAATGEPILATVRVVGRDHDVYTDPDVGDYHRMLRPGLYDLEFEAEGYDAVLVEDVEVKSGNAVVVDVQMWRTRLTAPNGGESLPAGVPTQITWTGNPSAQFHVQFTQNADETATVSDDFEDGSLGGDYTTGGNAVWIVTTSSAHGGIRAARSGTISHNGLSWLQRIVSGGEVRFWYRVSSESGWDFFNFLVDGEGLLHVSGESGWQQFVTTLPAGSHTLRWEYRKDGSVSNGSDCAWIDDLQLTQDLTTWTDVIALTAPGATETDWTPPALGEDYKVRVRSYSGGVYGAWDSSDAVFSVVEGWPAGDMDCDGTVNNADIPAFVLALTDPDDYLLAYPGCELLNGDIDGDGSFNNADIPAFVALLTGG